LPKFLVVLLTKIRRRQKICRSYQQHDFASLYVLVSSLPNNKLSYPQQVGRMGDPILLGRMLIWPNTNYLFQGLRAFGQYSRIIYSGKRGWFYKSYIYTVKMLKAEEN
jgi:hypothetical protein